ncbi:MAG: ribonuclease P protein component [Candidatus Paceibacterota bacterium]|jgi:ribonuclease P protein component
MLDKKFRLRKQKDFDRISKEGVYFSEHCLLMKAMRNELGVTRFGFIVSNKISGVAAKRNRIKRLLREAARSLQDKLKEGYDCLFIAKNSILEKESGEINGAVEKLLRKSGLYKE